MTKDNPEARQATTPNRFLTQLAPDNDIDQQPDDRKEDHPWNQVEELD